MVVYRIEREKYLTETLKGIGAALSNGFRWNSVNTRLVYTSESRALATLEVAVHLDLSQDLPTDRHYVIIDIPDEVNIMEVKREDLPYNWNIYPPIIITQFIGDNFVLDGEAAVLKVPSCLVPDEFNYLINPSHPDSKKIKIIHATKMSFDRRFKVRSI